jgi:hypothetical protein
VLDEYPKRRAVHFTYFAALVLLWSDPHDDYCINNGIYTPPVGRDRLRISYRYRRIHSFKLLGDPLLRIYSTEGHIDRHREVESEGVRRVPGRSRWGPPQRQTGRPRWGKVGRSRLRYEGEGALIRPPHHGLCGQHAAEA